MTPVKMGGYSQIIANQLQRELPRSQIGLSMFQSERKGHHKGRGGHEIDWHGWALYRDGDTVKAMEHWCRASSIHAGDQDALSALSFVGATP